MSKSLAKTSPGWLIGILKWGFDVRRPTEVKRVAPACTAAARCPLSAFVFMFLLCFSVGGDKRRLLFVSCRLVSFVFPSYELLGYFDTLYLRVLVK